MADPCDELYEICRGITHKSTEGHRKIFKQDDILDICKSADAEALQQVRDADKLLPLVLQLCRAQLFISSKINGAPCWGVRPRRAAAQVKTLSKDELMIYQVVESTYEEGAWLRLIKSKTGIKEGPAIDRILRRLISNGMIQEIRTVKVGAQRTYMLSYITPGVDHTGGSFFDAGELDESLVDEVGKIIIFHVRHNSWSQEKVRRFKRETSPIEIHDDDDEDGAEQRGRKKRKSLNGTAVIPNDIEELGQSRRAPMQVSLPVGYIYPTAESIHSFLISTRVLRGGKANSLTVGEVQNVINILVWDGKLESINGGYRTVRGVEPQRPGQDEEDIDGAEAMRRGNGLTEAPCGRCPVLDLCGKGSLISPTTCVYYGDWLQKSVGAAA